MVNQIKDFLREKTGYIKEGPKRLQDILVRQLNITPTIDECREAMSDIRQELKDNEYEPLTLKSKWQVQTKGGGVKFLKSYKNEVTPNAIWNFRQELIEQISEFSPEKPLRKAKKNKTPFAYEISLPDIHIGKGNIKELKDEYFSSIAKLMSRIDLENLERIILPIGNDGLNSEGLRQTTTRGTPQNDTLGWRESFRVYWEVLISAITWLSEFAPVDVICIPGNHDYERFYYLTDVLEAWFRKDNNVDIRNSSDFRKYYEYGNNMIMFTHGEKERPKDLAMNMPIEQPEMFARTKYRETHCGHFHKEMILDEFKQIKVRFIPSICTTDEWHKHMGFMHLRTAQAFIWNKENGFEGFNQVNI